MSKLKPAEKDIQQFMRKYDNAEQNQSFAFLVINQPDGLIGVPVLIDNNNTVEQIAIEISGKSYKMVELRPLLEQLMRNL